MLVRYRMNSSITIEQFKDDIHKIITGQITAVADLSAGCDKTNSQVLGPYPSGIYTAVDTASFTYSKVHNEYSGVTHYFRLGFDNDVMNSWTLSNSYTSETNTLVNSQALTDEFVAHGIRGNVTDGILTVQNFFPDAFWGPTTNRSSGLAVGDRVATTSIRNDINNLIPGSRIVAQQTGTAGSTGNYKLNKIQNMPTSQTEMTILRETSTLSLQRLAFNSIYQPTGIDFVITNKLFFISSPGSGINLGVFDLGKSGVSREFTNSMLMASIDLNSELLKIPYHYKFPTLSYGSMTDISIVGQRPLRQFKADDSVAIIENPAFMRQDENGHAVAVIYGLFLIPPRTVGNNTVYQDSVNLRRLAVNDYAILTE